jgi:nicotinate-nucleotide adenylyltransferase
VIVGLLGGAFDPPHNGHIELAKAAIRHFRLERLVVVPAGTPPHKPVETDAETRYRLAEAAFAGLPNVELSRQELERGGPSYTVETARWASQRWRDPIFVIGADEFADFPRWKDPDGVLQHIRLGVASRPGYPRERLDSTLSALRRPDRVEFFEIEPVPVASRDIRARIAGGEPVDGLVPPPVAKLIQELRLYRRRPLIPCADP